MTETKLIKLIEKLQALATVLDKEKDLVVHQRINQFYYLEKAAEFRILCEQLSDAESKINQLIARIEYEYVEVYNYWRKDIRWLNSIKRNDFNRIR